MQINSDTMILGDFNKQLSQHTDNLDKKINRETLDLNEIANQTDLTDIYIRFHPKSKE